MVAFRAMLLRDGCRLIEQRAFDVRRWEVIAGMDLEIETGVSFEAALRNDEEAGISAGGCGESGLGEEEAGISMRCCRETGSAICRGDAGGFALRIQERTECRAAGLCFAIIRQVTENLLRGCRAAFAAPTRKPAECGGQLSRRAEWRARQDSNLRPSA